MKKSTTILKTGPQPIYPLQEELTMFQNLITHSGVFHADDVLAYTVLSDLYPDANLIRTRDTNIINAHKDRSITFDVGNTYDPKSHIFDHHQPNAPTRENGDPYSSFGLVWKHFGTRWLVKKAGIPSKHADKVWEQMDNTIVQQTDKVDNGIIDNYATIETDITSIIFRANPGELAMDSVYTPVSDSARDASFKHTKNWVSPLLVSQAQEFGREAIGKDLVQKALDTRQTPGLVVLDTPVPWTKSIFDCAGQATALLVASPTGTGNEWGLRTVPTKPQGMQPRAPFPEQWLGLRGADMEKASGVKNAHFCHNGAFFCATEGKEAALELGKKALDIWKENNKKKQDIR